MTESQTFEQHRPEPQTLMGMIKVVWNARLLIIRNFILMAIASIGVALALPVWYTSQFTLLTASAGNQDMAGGGMGFGNPLASLGFGMNSEEFNSYISVMKSRKVREGIVAEFDLMTQFGATTVDEAIFALDNFIEMAVTDEGALIVTMTDQDPVKARDMASALLRRLGETMTELGLSAGSRQVRFLSKRISAIEREMAKTEVAIKLFTEEYGAYDLPSQLPVVMEKLMGMELSLALAEVEYNVAVAQSRADSPEVNLLRLSRDELKLKLDELMSGEGEGAFLNLKEIPEAAIQFAQFERDIAINAAILEYLYPQLEQARLKESKDEPTIQVLDEPTVPQKKSKPRRSIIVISASLFSILASCIWVIGKPQMFAFVSILTSESAKK